MGVRVRVRGLQRRRRDGCHTPTLGLEARFDMFSHSPVCPVRPVVAGGRCDLFGEIPSGMLGNRTSARGQARLRLSIHAGKMVTERMSSLLQAARRCQPLVRLELLAGLPWRQSYSIRSRCHCWLARSTPGRMRSRVRQCVTSIGKAIRDPLNSLGHDLLLSWPHDKTIAHLRSRFTVIWMLACCWGPRTLQPHPASRYVVLRSSCFLDIKSMYAPPPYLSSLPHPLPLCTSTTLPPGLEVNSPLLQSSPPSTPHNTRRVLSELCHHGQQREGICQSQPKDRDHRGWSPRRGNGHGA